MLKSKGKTSANVPIHNVYQHANTPKGGQVTRGSDKDQKSRQDTLGCDRIKHRKLRRARTWHRHEAVHDVNAAKVTLLWPAPEELIREQL